MKNITPYFLSIFLMGFLSCDIIEQKNRTKNFDDFKTILSDDVSPLEITLTAEGV